MAWQAGMQCKGCDTWCLALPLPVSFLASAIKLDKWKEYASKLWEGDLFAVLCRKKKTIIFLQPTG